MVRHSVEVVDSLTLLPLKYILAHVEPIDGEVDKVVEFAGTEHDVALMGESF